MSNSYWQDAYYKLEQSVMRQALANQMKLDEQAEGYEIKLQAISQNLAELNDELGWLADKADMMGHSGIYSAIAGTQLNVRKLIKLTTESRRN